MTVVLPVGANAPHSGPTGAAFDIVLLLHVACVVVGLGTILVSGAQAARLRSVGNERPPDTLREYFAPGVNWAGRILYGVPVFGFALLAMSKGSYGLRDGWVLEGLVLWVVGILAAEGLLWPAERRIQGVLAAAGDGPPSSSALRGDCRTALWAAAGIFVMLVLATVLMVAQP